MISIIKRIVCSLVVTLAACGTSAAASSPIGIWIDHTGRGAVEITDCGGKLCGRIVWVKDPGHNEGCNFQVIGDVKPMSGNKWDGGWIIDPDKDPNKKYDVEITPLSHEKLKILGYIGTKFLSETMTWTRAPRDLKKCTEDVVKPGVEPAPRRDAQPAPSRDEEPPSIPPPAAQAPERNKTGGKSRDCKLEFGGVAITFPCSD